jgi:hypothetical protein
MRNRSGQREKVSISVFISTINVSPHLYALHEREIFFTDALHIPSLFNVITRFTISLSLLRHSIRPPVIEITNLTLGGQE